MPRYEFPTLQSEGRKFGIDTVVAHQYRDQLDQLNRGSTLNVGNFVLFSVTGRDADEMAMQFDNTPPEPDPVLKAVPYRTVSLDVVAWATGSLLVARIIRTGNRRLWLAVGVVVGVGLMNKHTMAFWVFGAGVGLLVTPQRRLLLSWWRRPDRVARRPRRRSPMDAHSPRSRRCHRARHSLGRRPPTLQRACIGYRRGSHRIATAPEPNSSRLTSVRSMGFDSPANNVGP